MKKLSTQLLFLLSLISFFIPNNLSAQHAELRGQVFDESREPVVPAVIELWKDNARKYVVESDGEGAFQIKMIVAGTYVMKVSNLFLSPYTETIRFTEDQIQLRDSIILRDTSNLLTVVEIRPVINSEEKNEIGENVKKLPVTSPFDAAGLLPGVESRGGGLEIGKGKVGSTVVMREGVINSLAPAPISNLGMDGLEVIDRGVSARYGGFTGGAVRYKTTAIPLQKVTTIQHQSSSPFNAFHHNQFSVYLSRALKHRELDSLNNQLVLGYSILGSYQYQGDPNPSATGYDVLTNSARNNIAQNPLSASEVIGGYVPTASFLRQSDLEHQQAAPNAGRHDASIQGKISWLPTSEINIDFLGNYNYVKRRLATSNNVVMNSENNPIQEFHFYSAQLNYTHRVKSPYTRTGKYRGDSSDLLSSMYYSVELTMQHTQSTVMSAQHRDNIFDYGYVGKFENSQSPVYIYNNDQPIEITGADGQKRTVSNFMELSGFRDSLVNFTPGQKNPALAEYSSFFYNTLGDNISTQNLVQRGGLLNGQNMPLLYSLFNNPGALYGNYSKNFQDRYGLTAYGEASIHPFRNHRVQHDLEFGMSFQQDRIGYYNLNALSLWQLMPLLANQHIDYRDPATAYGTFDENGRFTDTVKYHPTANLSNQKVFDRNLRKKLIAEGYTNPDGSSIDATSRIDIHALSPDVFSIDMFTADELLNNGNPYVSYSGYDHTGNKTRGKTGLSRFLNDPQNRPVDAFNPIQASAWIQDKFVFRQLIVRAGFRFERYDANQPVLKDPFVLYSAKQAGEVKEINGVAVQHPASIGSDFTVYVDNVNSPQAITGYRKDEQWYDKNGNAIPDPSLIANKGSSGRVQPFLHDPENQDLNVNAFKKFEAQNLILPRISVSFPINRSSLFYVTYDKLAQNPDVALNYASYSSYYQLRNNTAGVIANPGLKARVKTEYSFGFKQLVGYHASLNITAAFATIRNDFNQYRVEGAYPYSYTSYSNIDFSAVKRYITEYEYQSNHWTLNINYALQFADGTGSTVNSAAALIQSGQPNLRSFFPLAFDNRHSIKGYAIYSFSDYSNGKHEYHGPVIGSREILKNAFISFSFQSSSGRPYTATAQPVSEAQAANGVVQRSQSKGNPFGNRMVWTHNADLRLEKAFRTQSNHTISTYLIVSNVFNINLVRSVYSYTGLPDDDGYLSSPQGQQQVRNQIDAETFTTLYKLRLNNQNNFGAPRNIQLGIKVNL